MLRKYSSVVKASAIGLGMSSLLLVGGCKQADQPTPVTGASPAAQPASPAAQAAPAPAAVFLAPERVINGSTLSQVATSVDPAAVSGNDLEKADSGLWELKGGDPFLIFPMESPADGAVQTKIGFIFLCEGGKSNHTLQVFWHGEGGRITEANNVRLRSLPGPIVLDMADVPNWTSMSNISSIRIDLASASCSSVDFRNVAIGS